MALSTQRASAFHPSADQSAPPQWNYDVFLSFRGVDTRNGILSHLYHELQNRCIKTFMDDPKLERGTTISSELFKAIQESRLAIVVLSPNYASSSWCLDELTKILQCMKSNGTVLPVFYNVDPSDVRKQSGSFADALSEHEKRFREDIDKVKHWRAALTEVANLSGLDSKNQSERKLVEKIVKWVWEELHRTFHWLSLRELLVGVKFTREQLDLLVAPTDDVRFVGIWGMGGIGKTTIAQLVYQSISFHFEVSCFLANVREASEGNRLVDLQKQLLYPILKKQITQVLNEDRGTHFIKSCLCKKKVLLILDDVNESSQLETLAAEKNWFGKGSIIIITTRDERLVKKHDMEISYKVEGLDDDEALKLFSRNAFKKFEPEEGFRELCKCFVNYAGGVPLALKIFGCFVHKRGRDEWESVLDKLHKIPDPTIFNMLKITYDRLDEMSQIIFLDVAFFHKGNNKEEVIDSYGKCGLITINDLVEKSLLTIDISNNIVEMHDLIQEMAFEIVRRESLIEPGERSRLYHCDDIIHVLTNNSATNKIQCIALSMTELEKADWNCEAFSKMINLKFLKVDNVIISSIPIILPNSLRIMKWNWYSSKYIPSNFQPNNLMLLEMQGSQLVRLWDERIDLPNLKYMDLSGSLNLAATPNFIGISKLKVLNLAGCENLVEIHPSIAFLKWLTYLILNGCKSVKSLPREVEMDSLIYFGVSGCSKLKKIPEFSGQVKNLSTLDLKGTPIEKLPSSIGRLVGLTFLDVSNCKDLLGLPSSIRNLNSLKRLYADGCSYSDKRQENSQEMDHLMISMPNYSESCSVGFRRYYPLKCRSEPNKSRFWWGLQRKAFVVDSLHGLWSLKELDLNDCGLCDIPGDIGCLSSLEKLNLSRNNFVCLPASIGCLSKLRKFWVNGCQRLQQLPHLRFGLVEDEYFCSIEIYTDDCTSLKMFPKLSIKNGRRFVMLGCVNCFGLVENALDCNSILLGMLWNTWGFLQAPATIWPLVDFQIITPGSGIPEWFNNQSVGDSLIVELPPCTTPIWIALCAVIEDDHPNPPHDLSTIFQIECRPGEDAPVHGVPIDKGHLVSPHLWVSCVYHNVVDKECSQMKISFETFYFKLCRPTDRTYCSGIKKCGFRLVHKQDVEELNQIMMMNHSINISTKATSPHNSHNSADASGSSHQKSLCRKSYALSKWFLTKLVKIFSLFLTTAVFIESFNNSEQWGCIGLLIWRVTTLISYLGLAPSYFELLLKILIKTVILKRAAKFLPTLLKTPPQMSAHKYLKG